MYSLSILLITFNRPTHTRRSLESILAARPTDLYVFQDGPRKENDNDKIRGAEVKMLIEELVDKSETRLHTLYEEDNLGCGPGPMMALNWFFSENEMGIVIEDDAIPHPDFFRYAEELLVKYKADESVCAIGSMNVDARSWGDGSYYFSMMNRNLCAWATWRRAWERFDIRMPNVSRQQLKKALREYGCDTLECEYWCDRLDEVHKDGCGGQSWDMQFLMSIWLNHGKGIVPNVNLSSNIGVGDEATHTMSSGSLIDNVPTQPIMPLTHPSSCEIQDEADRQFHFRYFDPDKASWSTSKTYYYLLNKRLKKLLGHQGPWLKKKK
ncbi:MAG: hypothetical protein IJG41_07375 [Bacteroidales bacterium]|nr:hypothetical protein [Bacteroidales bacterium]